MTRSRPGKRTSSRRPTAPGSGTAPKSRPPLVEKETPAPGFDPSLRFEKLLESVLSMPHHAFYVYDYRQGRMILGERELAALYGYTPEEVQALPESWVSLVHPEDRELHDRLLKALLEAQDDEVIPAKLRVLRKDGGWEWVVFHRRPYERDEHGGLISELGLVQVVTSLVETTRALKESEAALRQSEERYARVMRGINDGLWDWDIATGEDYLSPRWKELLGYRDDELPNHESTFRKLMHPDDQQQVWDAVQAHLKDGRVYDVELRLRSKSGEYRWFRARGHAERGDNGEHVRMAGSITDITDRRRAEEALRASEERYRFLADHTDDIVGLNDTLGGRLYISPSYFRKTGWTLEEVQKSDWRTRVHPHDLDLVIRTREANLAGEATVVEHRTRCRDGSWLWLETHCKPIFDAEGVVWRLLVFSHDITERKRVEAQYLRELEFNKALASNTTAFILVMDKEGRVAHINAAVEKRFGYSLEEVQWRTAWDVGIMDAGETERSKKRFARLLAGEDNPPTVIDMKTQSGQWLRVEISSTATRKADGSIDRIIVTGTDVTERDRLQREVLRISEREQARIGHDLHDGVGQTLTGVVALIEALECTLSGPAQKDAARISQLAREAVQEVRRLSHGLSPAAVKNRGLAGALQLLAETVRTNFRRACACDIPADFPGLDVEVETHLFRIAQEAVNNAMRHARADQIRIRLQQQDGEGVLVVDDDGKGLSRAKSGKASKGIGLRVMAYRAEIIGGDVQVLPRQTGGTEVVCKFPLPRKKSARKRASA